MGTRNLEEVRGSEVQVPPQEKGDRVHAESVIEVACEGEGKAKGVQEKRGETLVD